MILSRFITPRFEFFVKTPGKPRVFEFMFPKEIRPAADLDFQNELADIDDRLVMVFELGPKGHYYYKTWKAV